VDKARLLPLRMASTQRTTPATISLFSLPRKIRNIIYRKVLVVRHPLYLFQDHPGFPVETFAPEKPRRWLALLYVNRQIHDEASAVLYRSNQFIFVDMTRHQFGLIQSFFSCIGSVNAGSLSHLCINFPVTEIVGKPEKVILREDSLHTMKLLQDKCPSLTTLETQVHSQNSSGLINHDHLPFVREALLQIDAQLKAICSLERVIVRFYDGTPIPDVRELMQGFGWVITILNDEESEG